ncbi:MAG: hypothetical protein KC486_24450 [Myxococcales bacterium]|nr:hypothetical protein [Myxococcales bacterium]
MFDARPAVEIGEAMVRGLMGLAVSDDDLDPRERRFLEINHELLEIPVPLDDLKPATPAEVAAIVTSPEHRRDLMQRLVVMTALDEVIHPEELRLLRLYAAAMDVDEPAVDAMQRLVEGRKRLVALDVARGGGRVRQAISEWQGRGDEGRRLGGVWKLARTLLGGADKRLAERYRRLAEFPQGSLGRAFYEHCMANGYGLPGERGGTPERLIFHDLGHILADYPTDTFGEVQMGGFESGYMGEDGFSATLLVLLSFHLGVDSDAGGTTTHGAFNLDRYMRAFQRGKAMKLDLRAWDPWPFMDRPIAQVRAFLEIPPP